MHLQNAEKNRLSEITALISNLRCYGGGHAQNAAADFKRVDRHFRELDRLEREARERYNAEQAAKIMYADEINNADDATKLISEKSAEYLPDLCAKSFRTAFSEA